MLEVVNSFVEGVAEIARGSVANAAQFLENALARAMPVAIGFLANQVGLGGLGQKIGEMIETVRGLVDQALDWLIDKAVSAGTAFLNMVQSGVETVKGGIANLKEWWSSSEPVTTQDGQKHEIGFSGSGTSASLEIRSSPGTDYIKYLTGIKTKHSLTDAQIKPAKDKAAEIETEKQRSVPDDQKEAQGQTHPRTCQPAGSSYKGIATGNARKVCASSVWTPCERVWEFGDGPIRSSTRLLPRALMPTRKVPTGRY